MGEKTETQKRAQKKYMEIFMVARVRMDRDRYEAIQAHAEARGESVNGFINRAISETMERDGPRSPQEAAKDGMVSLPSEEDEAAAAASESQIEGV